MNWLFIIKDAYDRKVENYDNDGIKIFVEKGKITAEQYKEITKVKYTNLNFFLQQTKNPIL